jgi:hypothetical protein
MSELITLQHILWLWLFDFVGVTALIASIIYMHRENHKKHDVATQERKTIIDRIERLRNQIEEREKQSNNYFIFDHTRNEIVEKCSGLVKKDGTVKYTNKFKIDSKYVGEEVWVFAVLANGEETKLWNEVIQA